MNRLFNKKYFLGLAFSVLCMSGLSINAKELQVLMQNKGPEGTMTFSPVYLKANVGDTVKFVVKDKGHDAVSSVIPDGAKPFKGKINEEFTYKLEKEGVYVYVCTPHKPMNMNGIIQVGNPVNKDKAMAEIDKLESKVASNKGRLKKAAENIK